MTNFYVPNICENIEFYIKQDNELLKYILKIETLII